MSASILAAVPLAVVGTLGREGLVTAFLLVAGGVGLTLALGLTRPRFRPYAPLPVLVAAGALVAVAPVTTVTELMAGVAGLILLLVVGESAVDPRPLSGLLPTVGLPSLAVALALGSTIALPAGSAQVAIAAALVVGVLLLLAYLFARQESGTSGAAPPS
ncbi:MAG: hypothetical protein ACREDK_00600 [Thermoplasmata archaeon]